MLENSCSLSRCIQCSIERRVSVQVVRRFCCRTLIHGMLWSIPGIILSDEYLTDDRKTERQQDWRPRRTVFRSSSTGQLNTRVSRPCRYRSSKCYSSISILQIQGWWVLFEAFIRTRLDAASRITYFTSFTWFISIHSSWSGVWITHSIQVRVVNLYLPYYFNCSPKTW